MTSSPMLDSTSDDTEIASYKNGFMNLADIKT